MANETETFDQLCERLAYYIVRDIAKGTSAETIAHNIAAQTLLWRRASDEQQEARNVR